MIALRLSTIADVVGGVLVGEDVEVTGAAYLDNRTPEPGGLYVAVVGERADGHDFAAGAHAVLGSRPTDAPTVVVGDPVRALGLLARHVVDHLDVTVLALTGSQGKTGTKDYLAGVLRVLAGEAAVVATRGNNNNELGVPLTVLRATTDTAYLVVEMGARGVGHIARLCAIAPPRIAAFLNVGSAHVGEFGSRAVIAAAKGEIIDALDDDGIAVVNVDDPYAVHWADGSHRSLNFGSNAPLTWRRVTLDQLGRPSFDLGVGDGTRQTEWYPVSLRQTGRHQVLNAAAAAAMAISAGFGPSEVAAALSTVEPASRWRMEVTERHDGLIVINDAYNANPESMKAALEALTSIAHDATPRRRAIAVLGEMGELGAEHDAGHRAVGQHAAELGVDVLLVVGESARGLVQGAGPGVSEVRLMAGRTDAVDWLRHNAGAEDVVLIKASRSGALEWIAAQLLEDTTP